MHRALVLICILAVCISTSHSLCIAPYFHIRHAYFSKSSRSYGCTMSGSADERWSALPHVDRKQAIRIAVTTALTGNVLNSDEVLAVFNVAEGIGSVRPRSASSIDGWAAIPVWPSWPTPTSPTGGRVRPIALSSISADPFLLLAHHRHSFSPNDPLRMPFKAVGGALGLPYVGDEGFALHPHRGLDIWTIVLDGSDGFRHRDSLGGECTYRGGGAQFMRAGRGVMHEEMWETSASRSTKIELFQLWINLPARLKMSPPSIRYLGTDWGASYLQETYVDPQTGTPTLVRTFGDQETLARATEGEGDVLEERPPFQIKYAILPPGGSWIAGVEEGHTAVCYVRQGTVRVNGRDEVREGSTCSFGDDGDFVWLVNARTKPADVLLMTGAPLRESVALGGPIVMNTAQELAEAYAELRAGTFLSRLD